MIVHFVAGARPNFMKIAPLIAAMDRRELNFTYRIIHTGQHYDPIMSEVFFRELGIPQPHRHLGCGGATHAEQTARIMVAYESVCLEERPDMVVVVGDVDSTLACAVVAKKLNLRVAHVEAGLRSWDRSMPEEINRIVTDSISDLHFVTEPSGVANLIREGCREESIFHVGNLMADNVLAQKERLESRPINTGEALDFKRIHGRYAVATLHRPSNVDNREKLQEIGNGLRSLSLELPVAFPVHPRTRARIERWSLDLGPGVHLMPPLSYLEFLNLWKDSLLVVTDSGGLQEETTTIGVPCITVRENTERPITLDQGTSVLAGTTAAGILNAARTIIAERITPKRRPELWDGHAGDRIIDVICRIIAAEV